MLINMVCNFAASTLKEKDCEMYLTCLFPILCHVILIMERLNWRFEFKKYSFECGIKIIAVFQ